MAAHASNSSLLFYSAALGRGNVTVALEATKVKPLPPEQKSGHVTSSAALRVNHGAGEIVL